MTEKKTSSKLKSDETGGFGTGVKEIFGLERKYSSMETKQTSGSS
jgi:hypothetical protein